MTITIEASQNEGWGFFGTISHHAEPRAAWDMAFRAIASATKCEPWEVRAFLDSRYGRHFADEVAMGLDEDPAKNQAAIDAAVARWMTWTITRRTSQDTGIPAGLPYLTGFVVACSIEDDAQG